MAEPQSETDTGPTDGSQDVVDAKEAAPSTVMDRLCAILIATVFLLPIAILFIGFVLCVVDLIQLPFTGESILPGGFAKVARTLGLLLRHIF